MRSISRSVLFGLLSLLAVGCLFAGCAKKTVTREDASYKAAALRAGAYDEIAEQVAMPARESAAAVGRARATGGAVVAERMVHHNGTMHLRTPRPGELVDEATRIVEAAGGRVERLHGKSAVFRVPVKRFQSVFNQLLTLGEVLDQSITSKDITDAFTDVDLRLKIAQATHRRLSELLVKAKDEEEKIRILKELQRIRTRIEVLTAKRERLLSLARFSRITIYIKTRKLVRESGKTESIAAFKWIHDLSPFDKQVAYSGKPLEFEVPEGMVALDLDDLWAAESADGARIMASRHDKQPAGDTGFWLEAVRLRLENDYADVKVLSRGNYQLLRLEDRSETPYIYLVGLYVTPAQKLELVEVYYPSTEHERRYQKAVLEAIGGGAR